MAGCILVTGGTRGIGGAVARAVAAPGTAVAVLGRRIDTPDVAALLADLRGRGARAEAYAADVGDAADVARAFDAVCAGLGVPEGVVHAAGLAYSARVEALDTAAVEAVVRVNVLGTLWVCREAARRMSTARGGRGGSIVAISSMAATIGGRPGASVYAATKGAVDVFATGFAKEVAREGLRVNVVRPGAIATDMTAALQKDAARLRQVEASIPLGRMGTAEEVAAVVAWLLSPAASLVTGAHVDAGGGGFHVGAPG